MRLSTGECHLKLRKIVSGGQSGAGRTALECARERGLETGGWATKGYRVDGGTDPSLAGFGLVETGTSDYRARTHLNTRDSDITVWFGKTSPGYWCTLKGCSLYNKEFRVNPTPEQFRELTDEYEVINVAGNRARINPEVVGLVKAAFAGLGRTNEEKVQFVANILDRALAAMRRAEDESGLDAESI